MLRFDSTVDSPDKVPTFEFWRLSAKGCQSLDLASQGQMLVFQWPRHITTILVHEHVLSFIPLLLKLPTTLNQQVTGRQTEFHRSLRQTESSVGQKRPETCSTSAS